MVSVRYRLPNFSIQEAERLANERYGLRASASALPSERDQNFYLTSESGEEFVLKIANVSEERKVLELQNEAVAHLAAQAPSLAIPRLCLTKSGESISVIESRQQEKHFLRMLTYIPAKLLAKVRPHTPELLRSLGRVLGKIDHALQSFEHPAAHRDLKWDLSKAAWIHEYLPLITDPSRRKIVDDLLHYYEQHALPVFSKLRKSIVYNDANDYNVLVGGDPRRPEVIGVIDFGDLLFTQTLSELAVGAAYAMLDKVDPLSAASHIVAGFHENFPLSEAEMEALYPLICLRLCVSVTNSAYQRSAEPGNEYLTISEAPAWRLLEQLTEIHPRFAHSVFRDACHVPPCPETNRITEWLRRNTTKIGPIVSSDLSSNNKVIFDLSIGSLELGNLTNVADTPSLTRKLFAQMENAGASVGIGQYDEVRGINTSDEFRLEGNNGPLWRTLHLGLDLFQKPGSPIFASLDGFVHSFRNNDRSHDYGPTIVLQHTMEEGLDFFILYGHLSRNSLSGLYEGKPVKKGDQIGKIGSVEENGGWPPHVHFQIITDMLDKKGDFPGVALADQRNVWLSLCPDPNLIARIPEDSFPKPAIQSDEILKMRSLHLGNSLSISYEKPLHIVRGSMQYLYDENGRAYLDAVNNVPHVGHCHPRVVEAAQRQMAVLNTNTRYLHENLAEYADRLCSMLSEPLRVCYFVNSGSEANELALRMARAHTKAKDLIVLEAAYHGNTSTLIEISPYKFDGPGGSGAPSYVHKAKLPDVYRGQFKKNDPQAAKKYADEVAEQIDRIRNQGAKFCGFICESVLSCAGQVVLPDHYLEETYRHVRKAGGVCITDEVQVGFGRVGSHFWAFETQNVIPDIVTLGKPIGNGHPLGAVVTTPEIAASFSNGMEFFSTFGGNPVSCAVGLAVLDVMKTENLQSNALQTGTYLLQGLTGLKNKYPLVGDARGLGLFVGIELVLDRESLTPAPEQASYLANRMKERGILLSTDGPYHNVLKMKPPMVFTKANADFLVQTLDQILQEDFLST